MAKLIDTAVAQKADGIITQGMVPAEPVNAAIEAGIPVLVVDSDISDAEGRLAYIRREAGSQYPHRLRGAGGSSELRGCL